MPPGRSFSDQQPKDGDTILHCGHLGQDASARGAAHWFKYDEPVRFERPDGSHGAAEWLAVCATCFVRYGDKAPVRGDGQWTGDEPTIETEEN